MLKMLQATNTSLSKRILKLTAHLLKLQPQDSNLISIQGMSGAPVSCNPD